MSVILEEDIIQAYMSGDINEYDIVELYSEGYISDNTMELLITEDDYISEAVLDISYEMEALGEDILSRGIRNAIHALNPKRIYHKIMLNKHKSELAKAEKELGRPGDLITQGKRLSRIDYINYHINKHAAALHKNETLHAMKQAADASRCDEGKAESYYRNKAKESLRKAREHGDKIDPKGAERRKESMKTIAKANKK